MTSNDGYFSIKEKGTFFISSLLPNFVFFQTLTENLIRKNYDFVYLFISSEGPYHLWRGRGSQRRSIIIHVQIIFFCTCFGLFIFGRKLCSGFSFLIDHWMENSSIIKDRWINRKNLAFLHLLKESLINRKYLFSHPLPPPPESEGDLEGLALKGCTLYQLRYRERGGGLFVG